MRFIARTSLAGLEPVTVAGRPITEDYARLRELLRARGGEAAARLFAQPIVTWGNGGSPGSIAWYADASGETVPLATLPPERRELLGGRLRATLTTLSPLRADPAVAAALTLASPEGVVSVGDEVVLIGWGLRGSGGSVVAGEAELVAAFGPYWPVASAAEMPVQPAAVSGAGPAALPGVQAPPPPIAGPAAVATSGPIAVPGAGPSWLVPAGLALLAACLVLGIWFGLAAFHRRVSFAELGDPAKLQQAIGLVESQNRTLKAEIAQEQGLLAGNVCRLPVTKAGIAPLTEPVTVGSLPPGARAQFRGTLLDLLRQATVMVAAAAGPGRIVTGSGFFFAPDLVMTNRHVIADAEGTIVVVNKALGRPYPVTVLAETPDSGFFHRDLAVLKLNARPAIQPLAFTASAAQLDDVIATGFPAAFLLEQGNQAYAQLSGVIQGDMAEMPEMIATEGQISAIQRASAGLIVMPHTAEISSGNSGGPLVDACGRVVGVNTFIRNAADQMVHINYAQKADSAMAFLAGQQIAFTEAKTPCVASPSRITPTLPATPVRASPPTGKQ